MLNTTCKHIQIPIKFNNSKTKTDYIYIKEKLFKTMPLTY